MNNKKKSPTYARDFFWRTMADSNRRHQASEACALSIWANGAYIKAVFFDRETSISQLARKSKHFFRILTFSFRRKSTFFSIYK